MKEKKERCKESTKEERLGARAKIIPISHELSFFYRRDGHPKNFNLVSGLFISSPPEERRLMLLPLLLYFLCYATSSYTPSDLHKQIRRDKGEQEEKLKVAESEREGEGRVRARGREEECERRLGFEKWKMR